MNRAWYILPFALLAVNVALLNIVPAEDAYITFRYAHNLAHGYGLVYNTGEYVYGSTEVLFACMLAAGHILGADIPTLAVIIGHAANALSVALVLYALRRHPVPSVIAACVLAASPVAIHAASGFGMPLAGLLVACAFVFRRSPWGYVALALAAMIRPEASLLIAWFIHRDGWKRALYFVVPLLVFAGIVTWYYGSPVPNSLVAKASASNPAAGVVPTLVFVATIAALAFAWRTLPRDVIPLVVLALLYLCIAQYQNIGMRYQFWALPAILAVAQFRARRGVQVAVALCCAALYVAVIMRGSDTVYDERVYVGNALSSRTGTMLTTEAGWLPYYSGWRAYDAFGLYDAHIAHNGLTDEYIDRLRPDVIVSRVKLEQYDSGNFGVYWEGDYAWNAMVQTLHRYAISRHYYGTPFVRKSDALVFYTRDYEMGMDIRNACADYMNAEITE